MNYNNYIRPIDLRSFSADRILSELSESTQKFIDLAERAALAKVAAYIAHFFDVQQEFRPIVNHVEANFYLQGQRVNVEASNTLYVALKDVPANTAITDPEFWEQKDDRDYSIVEVVCDFIIYDLHSRINSNTVPENKIVRYDNAVSYLKSLQRGHVRPSTQAKVFGEDQEESTAAAGEFDGEDLTNIY